MKNTLINQIAINQFNNFNLLKTRRVNLALNYFYFSVKPLENPHTYNQFVSQRKVRKRKKKKKKKEKGIVGPTSEFANLYSLLPVES